MTTTPLEEIARDLERRAGLCESLATRTSSDPAYVSDPRPARWTKEALAHRQAAALIRGRGEIDQKEASIAVAKRLNSGPRLLGDYCANDDLPQQIVRDVAALIRSAPDSGEGGGSESRPSRYP